MSPDQKHLNLPVDVYVRVSKVGGREGDSFISPEVQEERAKALLVSKGLEVGEVFVDLDESGGKMDRPQFNLAMQRVRDGLSGGIAVHKLDRFARNTRGLLEYVEEIESHGAIFACVEPTLDTSDKAYGTFLLTLFGSLAELERAKITAGWGIAHDSHIERGVPAARVPFGYEKGEDGRLVPDPITGPIVTEIFQRRANGEGYADIARWLQETGVEKAHSTTPWEDNNIPQILKNRKYLGEVKYGDRVNPEAHPPLVDEELWNLVLARGKKGVAPKTKGDRLYSGLVFCSNCGRRMSCTKAGQTANGPYFHWRCKYSSCSSQAGISAIALGEFLNQHLAQEAVYRVNENPGQDDRLDQARQAVLDAENELGAFLAVARATDPGYASAVANKRAAVEEARAYLARIPRAADVDWREKVRQTYAEWSEFLGTEIDPQGDIDVIESASTEGITGSWLIELLELGGETAQEIVQQILKRVIVTGSTGGADGRVEVELL